MNPFFIFGDIRCDFIFIYFSHFFDEIPLSKPNSRSVASHLGLYCLPMSHKKDAMQAYMS